MGSRVDTVSEPIRQAGVQGSNRNAEPQLGETGPGAKLGLGVP
jgi:hypothetical protein